MIGNFYNDADKLIEAKGFDNCGYKVVQKIAAKNIDNLPSIEKYLYGFAKINGDSIVFGDSNGTKIKPYHFGGVNPLVDIFEAVNVGRVYVEEDELALVINGKTVSHKTILARTIKEDIAFAFKTAIANHLKTREARG